MSPELQSKRLKLIPYVAGLVTEYHIRCLNDKDHMRFSEQRHEKHSFTTQHKYLNEFPDGSHIWLIRREGADCGTITAYRDRPNRTADMGVLVFPEFKKLGVGREAWETVMDFLFGDGVRKVECGVMAANLAMRQLAYRSGMKLEGLKLKHFELESRLYDCLFYGKFK